MRKAAALALLVTLSACGGRGDALSERRAIPGAMNAPLVLEARPAPRAKAPALGAALRDAASGEWRARVEYSDRIDRPDLVVEARRNRDIARPALATLQRSFGTGEFRPYLGVGVGTVSSRFAGIEAQDGYAIAGVVGGDLSFTDRVGGYVQYDYAVTSENPALAERRKSHGLRFGLSISLN